MFFGGGSSMQDLIVRIESRVSELEQHRAECDTMHEKHIEHNKRHDDAMNNLTESNVLLAKSITDMNLTLSKLTQDVDVSKPIIQLLKNVGIAWGVNRTIFKGVIVILSGIITIAAAYNLLM